MSCPSRLVQKRVVGSDTFALESEEYGNLGDKLALSGVSFDRANGAVRDSHRRTSQIANAFSVTSLDRMPNSKGMKRERFNGRGAVREGEKQTIFWKVSVCKEYHCCSDDVVSLPMGGVRVKRRLLQKDGLDMEGRLSDSLLRGDSFQTAIVSFSFASNSMIMPAAGALTDTSILSVSIVTTSSAAPALATFYRRSTTSRACPLNWTRPFGVP